MPSAFSKQQQLQLIFYKYFFTCKWKYKYLSLSNNSGCRALTIAIASGIRPVCTASRIMILSSSELQSAGSCRPASCWNFKAASLKPSEICWKCSILVTNNYHIALNNIQWRKELTQFSLLQSNKLKDSLFFIKGLRLRHKQAHIRFQTFIIIR